MHKAVTDKREKKALLNKRQSRGAQLVNFSVGDYVLRSRVNDKYVSKLFVTWVNPYVVTEADSHSFRVRHLVTGTEQDVHPSRLKFYSDDKLEVNEKLLEYTATQGVMLKVDKLLEHRWNQAIHDYEVLVKWHCLEDIERSWEPTKSLVKDAAVLIQAYVEVALDTELSSHLDKIWHQN